MTNTRTREILSVSELNAAARQLLEGAFALIWVEGELSNVSQPGSGHLYFTLKDGAGQIRGAMFRNRNQLLRFKPIAGSQVLVRGRVSLYEPRGDYQLIVEHMEEAGEGALRKAFDALRLKLSVEGLFDLSRKRPLPDYPVSVGIITSPTGAALRDILSVLQRRFPALPVVVYPVTVQGQEAAPSIVAALAQANRDPRCEVLIVTRGGGSLEDLWAFNEEIVARAIVASQIPVISAVGHETDITIADFAADVRAPTPSAAAELVSPDRVALSARLQQDIVRLRTAMRRRLNDTENQIHWLSGRLSQQHPLSRLQQRGQRLDELEGRLHQAQRRHLQELNARLAANHFRLQPQSPMKRLALYTMRLDRVRQSLQGATAARLAGTRERLAGLARTLEATSPLATLGRGYAILLDRHGQAIREPAQAPPGSEIEARLARGRLRCRILSDHEEAPTD
ncbi:exodeoxyribonuclease VII large subunit [Acidihalobacter yilgarnensis]|uniref:Exodeoxyribonuclease 7 large subunit n=1 Tax=Acidihalobacter yilgarnensis TaxID=2819280 RepID=A0A1D8IN92_9GAMM|nr:exodeoxyribonuclease VII large subunit [Acidihalobacter yilgarnensis]AOU97936.1 exodeoxyribonuclease VII large subunit [Acidihalobacter yilgarnensis]